jgi:hypothetical protein
MPVHGSAEFPLEILRHPVTEGTGPVSVNSPCLHDLTRIDESQQPVLVQTFVAQAATETLGLRVLDWFAPTNCVEG